MLLVMAHDIPVTAVIATYNRRERLLATLARLAVLPDRPRVIVVDNGSDDGTAEAVRRHAPAVDLVVLPENRGAAGRTAGVQAAVTPYVAFTDDDSWWAPGALSTAVRHFERHPRLGLIAARILVGPEERLDPLSAAQAASPLRPPPGRSLPGPAILGFAACGAVVRREAYLQVGGFNPVLFFLGEERVLALDLAAAGWDLAYAPDVVAHHHPVHNHARSVRTNGQSPDREALIVRNDLLTDWMRRPVGVALRSSGRLATRALRGEPTARRALAGALRRAHAALAHRRRRAPHGARPVRVVGVKQIS
jgi:GT2 family glycosyltransferase